MDATKDVTLNEVTYQLTRFTPRVGDWLVSQFLSTNLLLPLEQPDKEITEKDLSAGLLIALRHFPEETFTKVKMAALDAVRRYGPAGTVTPLVMKDGRYVEPAPNPVETLALVGASLAFNLHCFFEPGALAVLRTIFPDFNTSPSQLGSVDTSSGQS